MTMAPVRVVFMGSDPIARPLLDALPGIDRRIEMVGVVTQPDRPQGRGQRTVHNPIKQWALEQNLPLRQPERCGSAEETWLQEQRVDLVLVMAYGQILKSSLLEIPSLGVFNLHASLLPKLRGASPIHTAIASGETVTGVSFMRIIPPLDAGPCSDRETVPIAPTTTSADLIRSLAGASVPLATRALPAVIDRSARFVEQDPNRATYCRRIFKEDALLDFEAPADVLDRRIRAFQPWPGAVFSYANTPLKIGRARPADGFGAAPGTLSLNDDECRIACGVGSLQIELLQRPGGRMLPVGEFRRGFPLEDGKQIPSHPLAPLVAKRPFPWKWRPGDAIEGDDPL